MRISNTAPALPSNRQLSGNTIAARPPGSSRGHDVLDEVELLAAGLDGEVVAVGRLIRAFRAEGRIDEHHVVSFAAVLFINGVAEKNVRLDALEEKIHQREPARARH